MRSKQCETISRMTKKRNQHIGTCTQLRKCLPPPPTGGEGEATTCISVLLRHEGSSGYRSFHLFHSFSLPKLALNNVKQNQEIWNKKKVTKAPKIYYRPPLGGEGDDGMGLGISIEQVWTGIVSYKPLWRTICIFNKYLKKISADDVLSTSSDPYGNSKNTFLDDVQSTSKKRLRNILTYF